MNLKIKKNRGLVSQIIKNMKTKFYTFSQNNSGGSFVNSDLEGISEYVIIEAMDAQTANDKAENIGLYFNGCNDGIDCSCCGDRWHDSPDYYDTIEEALEDTYTTWGGTIAYLADGKSYRIEVED